jgi:hypothetical protein
VKTPVILRLEKFVQKVNVYCAVKKDYLNVMVNVLILKPITKIADYAVSYAKTIPSV